MTRIEIDAMDEGPPKTFTVTVTEGEDHTVHEVTMDEQAYKTLGDGGHTPTEVVHAAFEFLLDRESKESILASFDIMAISRYFPEFKEKIGEYLA